LRNNGFLYPQAGIDIKAAQEKGEIGFRHSRFIHEYNQATYQALLNQLNQEIDGSGCQQLLLSAEPWAHPGAAQPLNVMVSHLLHIGFNEVQGVVFLRNIRDYMVRHYREWTRRNSAYLPFPKYIVAQKHFFDYLTICKNIKRAFRENVAFFSYEETGDVNRFFFAHLGLNYKQLSLPDRSNQGRSCVDAEISRILNQYGLHIRELPDGASLLAQFGLGCGENVFREDLPPGLTAVFGEEYMREFASITGLGQAVCQRLFANQEPSGIDISVLSPILEKIVFEWLRRRRDSQLPT
jgi:hypothetical protein